MSILLEIWPMEVGFVRLFPASTKGEAKEENGDGNEGY